MADLLGSILNSMEKPPSSASGDKNKAKAQQKQIENAKEKERQRLDAFKKEVENSCKKIQQKINDFASDSHAQKHAFPPADKIYRAIVHEVAEVAGLVSYTFGQDETERYIMIWKKEFAPCEAEIAAYKRGEAWDPEKEKARLLQEQYNAELAAASSKVKVNPATNYKDKYEHLIGRDAAKAAAIVTTANKSYGFVPSENKRDQRSIEEVMRESQARKKLKKDDD